MLGTQVDYWNLVETKRHNLATEQFGKMDAETNRRNAETNARNAESNAKNAETNRLNYGVNLFNAETNSRNASTNARNADINARNADTNAKNADTNAYNATVNSRNADINARNAETNRLNYGVNLFNAETQKRLASVAEFNAVTDRVLGEQKLGIDAWNAYTNQFNAETNAHLTNEQAHAQQITNVTLPYQNAANIGHTIASTVNQSASALHQVTGAVSEVAQLPGHIIQSFSGAFSSGASGLNSLVHATVPKSRSKKR